MKSVTLPFYSKMVSPPQSEYQIAFDTQFVLRISKSTHSYAIGRITAIEFEIIVESKSFNGLKWTKNEKLLNANNAKNEEEEEVPQHESGGSKLYFVARKM